VGFRQYSEHATVYGDDGHFVCARCIKGRHDGLYVGVSRQRLFSLNGQRADSARQRNTFGKGAGKTQPLSVVQAVGKHMIVDTPDLRFRRTIPASAHNDRQTLSPC
jgi:hypothetical protein